MKGLCTIDQTIYDLIKLCVRHPSETARTALKSMLDCRDLLLRENPEQSREESPIECIAIPRYMTREDVVEVFRKASPEQLLKLFIGTVYKANPSLFSSTELDFLKRLCEGLEEEKYEDLALLYLQHFHHTHVLRWKDIRHDACEYYVKTSRYLIWSLRQHPSIHTPKREELLRHVLGNGSVSLEPDSREEIEKWGEYLRSNATDDDVSVYVTIFVTRLIRKRVDKDVIWVCIRALGFTGGNILIQEAGRAGNAELIQKTLETMQVREEHEWAVAFARACESMQVECLKLLVEEALKRCPGVCDKYSLQFAAAHVPFPDDKRGRECLRILNAAIREE